MAPKTLNDMTVFEQSRWYALMDAVDMIANECDKRGKDFNKLKLPPLDIEKYINTTSDSFAKQIRKEQNIENDVLRNLTPTQLLLNASADGEKNSEEISSDEDAETPPLNIQDF